MPYKVVIISSKKKILLTNHAVVALGILTRRAKTTLGEVKVSEILNDQHQAYTLLAQSVLYGDEALISLTEELNATLQIAPNLILALGTYVKYLRTELKGSALVTHRQALSLFGEHLFDIGLHSSAYREASDTLLATAVENESDHTLYLNLIRSFYPYWENTHRVQIQAIEKQTSNNDEEKKAIINVWEKLDNAFLTRIEESLLATYTSAINTIDIPDEQVQLRTKIAKLILIKQRAFDKTSQGYRRNISSIEKSLSSHDLLAYFLLVAREFHQLWLDAQFSQTTPER